MHVQTAVPPGGQAEPGEPIIRQYSLRKILGVWAAAAVPVAVLSWVAAPLLEDRLSGPEPLAKALILFMTAGLAWQFVLVLLLVRSELGQLRWSSMRDALWLRSPHDQKTGRTGGRLWLWALLFILLTGVWQLVPGLPAPAARDFAAILESDRGELLFEGAWGWFAILVVMGLFNTVLGEELLFRGVLLPRMQGVFGRRDWIANGVLFAAYHLHMPWVIPSALADTFLYAYPARRFRSAWMGILVHSAQTVVISLLVLFLVLG